MPRSWPTLPRSPRASRRSCPRTSGSILIGGAAGAIASLLGLHQVAPSEGVLRAAVACGAHLIQRAQPAGKGVAWPCTEDVLAPLTGFAHGAAGIAWALFALAKATGQPRFESVAQQAIAYERGAFVPGEAAGPTGAISKARR